ncbi:MAG TPA: right-handed parallel beta-helix repeat-containing protein, partial [Anaerolineales bacterium]|nr:right-handed parallel beta-helix repeat-containing protein [Anaerolineales bacterium]
ALIQNNLITGNRTGIDINQSSGHIITGNDISDNHTGMIFRNTTDNLTVISNKIMNNRTVGVLFLDASGGTNLPVQSAIGSTFRGNNISGNWYGQVVDRQTGGALPLPNTTNTKDFQGNWWGSPTPSVAIQNSVEPLCRWPMAGRQFRRRLNPISLASPQKTSSTSHRPAATIAARGLRLY